jgi:hypothetical protein
MRPARASFEALRVMLVFKQLGGVNIDVDDVAFAGLGRGEAGIAESTETGAAVAL